MDRRVRREREGVMAGVDRGDPEGTAVQLREVERRAVGEQDVREGVRAILGRRVCVEYCQRGLPACEGTVRDEVGDDERRIELESPP